MHSRVGIYRGIHPFFFLPTYGHGVMKLLALPFTTAMTTATTVLMQHRHGQYRSWSGKRMLLDVVIITGGPDLFHHLLEMGPKLFDHIMSLRVQGVLTNLTFWKDKSRIAMLTCWTVPS